MNKKWLKKSFKLSAVAFALLFILANWLVLRCGEQTVNQVHQLPIAHACLVLGTSKTLANGSSNLFYQYRMNAAFDAYASGKCKKLVVSGDNRVADYNEPELMKSGLMAKGIPESAIHCDYAGGRTLDSVIRFKEVFGQSNGIVISQKFHNSRAIYLARHHGIQLVGLNAQEVEAYHAFKTKVRENFSRFVAVIDVVLDSQPRHLGAKVKI